MASINTALLNFNHLVLLIVTFINKMHTIKGYSRSVYLCMHRPLHCMDYVDVSVHSHTLSNLFMSSFLIRSLLPPAEEDWSHEDTGEEGAMEREKGGEAAEEGRRGGGERRGEWPAHGGSP